MPSTLIEVCREYTPAEETALMDAVQAALVSAFAIPARDRHVRLMAHLPHRVALPPDQPQADRYTLVTIDAFAGRSLPAKRRLYQDMVRHLGTCGIPAACISIVLREHPLENWGIRGGQAACDLDLGFKVDV